MSSSITSFLNQFDNLVVITGAGISTASGIPDYRDSNGEWKHRKPMSYQDFIANEYSRQYYWVRSALGRQSFRKAKPSQAHLALAKLEASAKISKLITQNVDGLHRAAGSRKVIELHGGLDRVVCLDCRARMDRDDIQDFLVEMNPGLSLLSAAILPDGDTQLEAFDFSKIKIPACEYCNGMLKPDVVFFGESVPADRVQTSIRAIDESDAMLVVGSSLMVYSGFRFVRYANEKGIPIGAINQGKTRADELFCVKTREDCNQVLAKFAKMA